MFIKKIKLNKILYKMPGHPISQFDRARIVALHQEGLSNHQISARLNIPRTTVRRILTLFQETGSVERRRGTGRPRVTSGREDRYVTNYARRNRRITVTALRSHFLRTYRRRISRTTIRRRLHASNLRARRPLRVPRVSPQHRAARLQWAMEHRDWFLAQWQNVLFSDESRFGLQSDSRRERVWRGPGRQERLLFAREVVPYQGGTVMFWGGIMYGRRTPLILIERTMTGTIYAENIIEPIIQPLRNEFGANFVFQDDNARPHRTRRIQNMLEENNIVRMVWPANSPDMNPIEHVWDHLASAILNRENPPLTLRGLVVAAQEEWDNMDQQYVDNLIRGMPRRVGQLIEQRGNHTEY